MERELFKNFCEKNKYSEKQIEDAFNYLDELQSYLKGQNNEIDNCNTDDVKKYVKTLVDRKLNTPERLIQIARYFYVTKKYDIYIYFTSIFGGSGVIENIKQRAVKFGSEQTKNNIFNNLIEPELGSTLEENAIFTKKLMENFNSNVDCFKCRKILAGNNHGIPKEYFLKEKEIFFQIGNMDDYLKDFHNRKVKELEQHYKENKIWFEQVITQEIIDFVKSNQEILSAVRQDNYLYVTKIPYNTTKMFEANSSKEKRYHACHCPFVREAIMKDMDIDSNWCYCSAGFEKYPFDVIFDQELDVEVLSSAINGDEYCRFKIKLPAE